MQTLNLQKNNLPVNSKNGKIWKLEIGKNWKFWKKLPKMVEISNEYHVCGGNRETKFAGGYPGDIVN